MVGEDKEKKFTEAYDNYSDAIFRYCYYSVFDRDKAKDFVQETYCRTWSYMAQGKEIKNIRPFLYRTAKNIIIDNSRKKQSFSLDRALEKGFSSSVDTRKKTEDYFLGQEMIKIVKSLDKKYRDVIIMKYVNDLSAREISEILNETENNVYVIINRGIAKVKEILKKQS